MFDMSWQRTTARPQDQGDPSRRPHPGYTRPCIRLNRRNIRLIEKLTCKGTLRQVLYLSEAPSSPPLSPYFPTPIFTLYTSIQYHMVLIHMGKGGGRELIREKVTGRGGAIVHKAGRKYQHD
jgi:hypothetical protein